MIDFVERSEVLEILQGFNPWWLGQSPALPEFRRLAFGICKNLLEDPQLKRAILLSGPRRVGKTTILQQIAAELTRQGKDPKSILYLSLDHPILKLEPLDKILRIYHDTIHPEGEPAVLLLDEVQYSEDWDSHIKQMIDHRPYYRILATGSSSVVHRRQLAESGVGRWSVVPIPTLSFYEFLQIRGKSISGMPDDLRPSGLFELPAGELQAIGVRSQTMMTEFSRYLLVGGFPESALHPDIGFSQRLLREDVVERVLKRDMTSLFGLRNVNDLERVFLYICLHSGGIIAVKTCADALGSSPTTVSNYLDLIEQANLIFRLSPTRLGGKKVLKARQKIYLVDAALRNAVLLKGEEILSDSREMGAIVETTVLRHVFAYYYRDTPQIQYWNESRTDREVDIIVRSPRYTIPVEVKYRARAPLNEDEGIVRFCRGEEIQQAYWVTQIESDIGVQRFDGLSTAFLRIPAHLFCYLLGQAERLLWGI
jgi:predicted AAA+ superfamily ATPase